MSLPYGEGLQRRSAIISVILKKYQELTDLLPVKWQKNSKNQMQFVKLQGMINT